jgi:alpha-1,2-mannosyltransferase
VAGPVATDGGQHGTDQDGGTALREPRRTDGGDAPGRLPGLRTERAGRRAQVLLATAASLLLYEAVRQAQHFPMIDMVVYRDEGNAVRHGHDLYAMLVPSWKLYATYPPFAALMFLPTTFLPVPALRAVVTCANLALLGLLARLSFRLVGWPRQRLRPPAAVAVVGAGVWLEPVYTTLRYGQINLLIACLVLADLTRPDHARGKGLLIGIATGIKLTPGVFGVYLLLSGRPRAALVSLAGFAGTVLLGWTALPRASWSFWSRYLFDSDRVGAAWIVDNQSLRGALARLLHEEHPGLAWALAAGLTASAGLAIAVRAARSGHCLPHADAWGAVCAALTALLISPISWTHHWVWCVPILVLLAAESAAESARPRAVGTLRWRLLLGAGVLAFAGYGMWLTPHHPVARSLHLTVWQQLPGSVYPAFGLLLLGVAQVRTARRRRAAAADGPARPPGRRSR